MRSIARARSAPTIAGARRRGHEVHRSSRAHGLAHDRRLSAHVAVGLRGGHGTGVLGGLGSQPRGRLRGLLPPAHRLRAEARRALSHPALRLDGDESERGRRPRALARGAQADPEVPRPADGARHRRDRPQPRHPQRDRNLHRADRAGARPQTADPHSHAAPRGQAEGARRSLSTCCGASRRSSPAACSSTTPKSTRSG